MSKLTITEHTAYRRATGPSRPWTYSTPCEVLKIQHGKEVQYVVGYALGWEGDDGDVAELLCEKEFDKRYSMEYIRG